MSLETQERKLYTPNRWDLYFRGLCNAIGENSRCLSRQIGAILVYDRSVISTGYNGPPRGVPHCGKDRYGKDPFLRGEIEKTIDPTYMTSTFLKCPRRVMGYPSGEGLEWCPAAHAEQNCIANAAREGHETRASTMYMNCGVPCKICMAMIVNAGIIEVVCSSTEIIYDDMSIYIAKSVDLLVRDYDGRML
jgi:dCMP deaminase